MYILWVWCFCYGKFENYWSVFFGDGMGCLYEDVLVVDVEYSVEMGYVVDVIGDVYIDGSVFAVVLIYVN